MRVMVTGASGFIGSYTVAALLEAGHQPCALVRSVERAGAMLASAGADPDAVTFVVGDIRDRASVAESLAGCDAAVHAAASIGITQAVGDVHDINVTGTQNVVGGALDCGIERIVHLSSIAVFVPPDQPVINSSSALASPRNAYGRTKVEAELYVRGLQDKGAPIITIYPGGVCGPAGPGGVHNINAALHTGLERLWLQSSGVVSLLDVRDLAEAIRRSLDLDDSKARRWLLGGRFFTWPELIDLSDELTGLTGRRIVISDRVLTGLAILLDAAKRVRSFDFPLTRDAAEMLLTQVPSDDSELLTELDLSLRPAEHTLADTFRWLVAQGHLPPEKIGKLG
jgi:nucleoside-diphosphate-sugar epimerase